MADETENVRRTVELLWRAPSDVQVRPGPRQRTTVEAVVRAAVAIADANGLAQLSMRVLAADVGLKPMGLYTYVPNREILLALMVDAVAVEDTAIDTSATIDAVLRAVADQYRDEILRHPWLLDVPAWRPVPGPGSSHRYEVQLSAVAAAGARSGKHFGDVELDAVIASLRAFAIGNARSRIDQMVTYANSGMTDEQWWETAGPLLADAMPEGRYPISSRVGTAVGEEFAGPGNADHAYEFGLTRLIAGIIRG
ncbi:MULTISPECIES: TetR/AcrR family transcriptional regulator C-terminal domain-containing protein [Gordonia]|uniref:TetR/AcrR family transcriptional regulator n=1 Tax=Gordonia cholesterolivorans TaxID=559625 RepID=A0ABN3HPZ8_9ACTN|nr:TetR/AcrR family transcriptional regulator C-terminal domain-containing protein [Gordonia sp. QH-12]KXT56298.1 transcriptional regulator [Gordonia sp. QH-12]